MAIDRFYKDSFTLTISNMITGIIGFIYSIVLSRRLGAEGLGLYGLIMPVYGLLLCLTSEGLVTAISKISAVYNQKKDYRNLNKTLKTIFFFVLVWSISVALLTLIASSGIAAYIINDSRASDAIKIICPALIFVPLSAIIKGYFYGLGKFKTAAYVDILEKAFRILILLGTVAVLALNSVKSVVTAAYFSLAAGELTSLSVLYVIFKISRNRAVPKVSKAKGRAQLLFDVLVISFPLTINGFISSILSTASTLILPHRLMHAGLSYNSALSMIGKFSGMSLNIVYLPYIIVGSMLTVLIPDLSLKLSRKDAWGVEDRILQVFKISVLVGIGTASVCFAVPDTLGELFYGRDDIGDMIRFAAAAGFTSYVSSPTFGILNALGKQFILFRNSLFISVENLILIFILTGIRELNIYGYGITIIVISVSVLLINVMEIRKICYIRFPLSDLFVFLITGAAAYLSASLAAKLAVPLHPALRCAFTAAAAVAAICFVSRVTKRYRGG